MEQAPGSWSGDKPRMSEQIDQIKFLIQKRETEIQRIIDSQKECQDESKVLEQQQKMLHDKISTLDQDKRKHEREIDQIFSLLGGSSYTSAGATTSFESSSPAVDEMAITAPRSDNLVPAFIATDSAVENDSDDEPLFTSRHPTLPSRPFLEKSAFDSLSPLEDVIMANDDEAGSLDTGKYVEIRNWKYERFEQIHDLPTLFINKKYEIVELWCPACHGNCSGSYFFKGLNGLTRHITSAHGNVLPHTKSKGLIIDRCTMRKIKDIDSVKEAKDPSIDANSIVIEKRKFQTGHDWRNGEQRKRPGRRSKGIAAAEASEGDFKKSSTAKMQKNEAAGMDAASDGVANCTD